MLPAGTRFLGASADKDTARSSSKLSRVLPLGHYHEERKPERFLPASAATTPLHVTASHTLPLGWEQRVERPGTAHGPSTTSRVFYIDHGSRTTTLVDPRVGGTATATDEGDSGDGGESDTAVDAMKELLLLASGVLPEQVVSPADFRAVMHRALRKSLSHLTADGPATAGGVRERRLQLQQHISRALLERFLAASHPLCSTVDEVRTLILLLTSYLLFF